MANDAGPIEKFCGSEFWNLDISWNTNDPDFTPCFEQTILLWVPCAFLWIFMFLELYYLRASLDKNIPWNFKNLSKIVLHVALHALCILDFVKALILKGSEDNLIYPVDVWTPVIKFFTIAIAIMFVFLNRKFGVQSSGTLFLFWFLLVLFGIPQFRTEIRGYTDRHENDYTLSQSEDQLSWADYKFISFMIFFGISVLILILNCFSDNLPRETKYNRTPKEIPEVSASFLSRMTFSWFDKMAWLGYRKPLEQKDLWELRPQESSKEVMPTFAKHWNKNVRKNYTVDDRDSRGQSSIGNIVFENPNGANRKTLASVMPPIYKSFGGVFLFGSVFKLVTDVLSFASPKILGLIIGYVETKADGSKESEPEWRGILYAILLFLCAVIQTMFSAQYFHKMYIVGLRTRTAVVNAIYRKALVISNSAKKESTVGEIVNLMAVDAQRFLELVTYVNMIWSAPLQIILALFFLWQLLGIAVLSGLIVMIILIPINLVVASRSKKFQVKQMKYKDERVKLMNEILSGMKVLKLYAWEPSFEQQVMRIRDKEIATLKSAAYLNAGTSFIWSCAPFLVSLVTFTTYVLIDEKNVLDASTAFVSLSLFNLLRFPLAMLPMLISNLIQTQVSIKRINKFLNSEELDPKCVGHDATASKHPMLIENGTFSWGDDVILKDINMEIKKNTLVAIVGTVGSGKSSIISAFLGEMDKLKGTVNTVGSLAYVPQQAWMQNATLRDNILFGKPYDRKLYQRVIDACALRSDFQMLAAGDQTEIGEKGINLSGGQKQRVSLARAVYSDSDLYLLDDPLSAVDSHVGKHIFEKVIGPTGLLANKTRVLVTHGITYLPKVDNIYVLKGGEVSEDGTYSELLNQKGAFAEFLIQHITENSEEIDELDEIAEQLESTIQSEEMRGQFVRAISRARSESIVETGSIRSFGSDRSSNCRSNKNEKGGSIRKRQFSRQESVVSVASRLSDLAVGKDDGKLIGTEKSETGGVGLAVYQQYIQSIGVCLAISTILLYIGFQVFSIGSNLWLTQWSNDERAATDTSIRNMYLGIYGGLGLGQVVLDFTGCLTLSLGCIYCSKSLHEFLTNNAMRFPMDYFDTTPLGRILNRFSKDIDTVDNTIPMNLRMFLVQFFSVIATLTVICISTPIFIVAIIPMALIYWFAQRFYVATSRQLMRLESITRSPIYSHFSETVTGVTTIRAYQVGDRFIQESDDRVDLNQLCKYPSIIANRWLAVRLETIGSLAILLSSLFAVLGNQSNAALVGLSVTYSLQITQTLNMLVRVSSDIETNIVSVERINEYGGIKQEAAWEIPGVKTPEGWPQTGRVMFENYMVRYREGLDLVLKGVNFDITGGEKVGIVGRTGAGKSSLTLSLFRIIEAAGGRILIDGVDISKLGLHTLRSRLTIIPQDPVLFSGSLRMNLDPYNRNNDAEIWSALELSHLKEFVKGMPAGLNHQISEGGENLSVGQRQLVCLARALLRKTKVLVLDEATAAVDLETDDLIQKTIRSEFKDCTVLTIAHRLNTILDSDKVIVLDQGRIIEFDSPNSLLQNKNSSFYSMAKDANLV